MKKREKKKDKKAKQVLLQNYEFLCSRLAMRRPSMYKKGRERWPMKNTPVQYFMVGSTLNINNQVNHMVQFLDKVQLWWTRSKCS